MFDDPFEQVNSFPEMSVESPLSFNHQINSPAFNIFDDFLRTPEIPNDLPEFPSEIVDIQPPSNLDFVDDMYLDAILQMPPVNTHKRTSSTPVTLPAASGIPKKSMPTTCNLVPGFRAATSRKARHEELTEEQQKQNQDFFAFCQDQTIKFNPKKLNFIPQAFWQDTEMTFGQLISEFFHRKNSSNSRFSHKLFNALQITKNYPQYINYIGISWVNNSVLKVDKIVFGRLLNIKTIDGSFFHQQGNFPTHGFVEIEAREALNHVTYQDMVGVDFEIVRLLRHGEGKIERDCTEADIESCKWTSAKKREALSSASCTNL